MIRLLFCLPLIMQIAAVASAADPEDRRVQFRRPADAVIFEDGATLAVANRHTGTVSLVDLTTRQRGTEIPVGKSLRAIARWVAGPQLAVVDFERHELVRIGRTNNSNKWLVRQRIPVSRYPSSVALAPNRRLCCVGSLWSRRLTFFDVTPDVGHIDPQSARVVSLPFAPGALTFASDEDLVVADAFGGRLAVVEAERAQVRSISGTPWHNISDLALGRDGRLRMPVQKLHRSARTEAEHIHWGVLLQNQLATVALDARGVEWFDAKNVQELGEAGRGAGDPSSVAILPDRFLVTLAGTNELAILDRIGVRESRINVGFRPVRVVITPDEKTACVVNQLSDSVSIIDLASQELITTVSLGDAPEDGPVQRGERAFFNARLSLENWMSCHSCHTSGHTNNGLADTLGDGSFGNAKRVPSLLGVSKSGPWAWNGSQKKMAGQLKKTLADTMHFRRKSDNLARDLAAYLATLRPPPSLTDARGEVTGRTRAGRKLFDAAGCVRCHNGPSFTSRGVFDVGLPDETGLKQFNPPSLLGVSQRDRLLHDGRARSLDEVVSKFGHPGGTRHDEATRRAIADYLKSL